MRARQLREFSPERLELVRQQWVDVAGEDEFEVELSTTFGWCTTHLSPQAGDSQAFELYNPELDHTEAILELVDSRKGAKLLKLIVSPKYWPARWSGDAAALAEELVRLHAAAFVEVIRQGMNREAPVVKIYGRSKLMLAVLEELRNQWPNVNSGSTATMEGRWLAISLPS